MATGTFALYGGDGVTPLTTPRPTVATWETIPRGTFANGVARVALGKKVVWDYKQPISAAQYQQLVSAKQAGRQTIETWVRPSGGVAGHFAVCTALMDETIQGMQLNGGDYHHVSVTFSDVREVG